MCINIIIIINNINVYYYDIININDININNVY